jgi:AraC-like DNA-binding protein
MDNTFLFVSIIGLSLSILILFFNKGYKSANLYLAGFFFFISLYLLNNYIFTFSKSTFLVAVFITTIPTFFFLIGPLSYFYIRSIIRDNSKLSQTDYVHFALFFIAFLGTMPILFSFWVYKQEVAKILISNNWSIKKLSINIFLPPTINQGIRPLHWLFYLFCNWQLFQKKYAKPIDTEIINHQYKLIKRWLLIFCTIFTLLTILLFFIIVSNLMYKDKATFLYQTYHILVTIGVVYIALNVSLLLFPHILYGLPVEVFIPSVFGRKENSIAIETSSFSDSTKTEESEIANELKLKFTQLFSPEYLLNMKELLEQWELEEKYINPDFNLNSLSVEAKIPLHHLSYYFNSFINVKFTDWRNKLRINYACKEMETGKSNDITIEALAANCGFSSQSTFIRSFKTYTELTPSEYIKQLENS